MINSVQTPYWSICWWLILCTRTLRLAISSRWHGVHYTEQLTLDVLLVSSSSPRPFRDCYMLHASCMSAISPSGHQWYLIHPQLSEPLLCIDKECCRWMHLLQIKETRAWPPRPNISVANRQQQLWTIYAHGPQVPATAWLRRRRLEQKKQNRPTRVWGKYVLVSIDWTCACVASNFIPRSCYTISIIAALILFIRDALILMHYLDQMINCSIQLSQFSLIWRLVFW